MAEPTPVKPCPQTMNSVPGRISYTCRTGMHVPDARLQPVDEWVRVLYGQSDDNENVVATSFGQSQLISCIPRRV